MFRLNTAGPLEKDPKSEALRNQINTELAQGVPLRVGPTVVGDIKGKEKIINLHITLVIYVSAS